MCSLGNSIILSVDPSAIPDSAREPADSGNITDEFGFVIVWNVPEPSEFIYEYEVLITEQARRNRRNEPKPMRFLVPSNENQFEFTDGTAYTDYLALVNAMLNVSVINGSVPALVPITLQTAQGSELAQGCILEFCSCTISPPSPLLSLSPSLLCIPVSSLPEDVKESDVEITSFNLMWTAPKMPNGRIIGYRVSIITTPSVHMEVCSEA